MDNPAAIDNASFVLARLRSFLLWLLALEIVGVTVELLLLAHWDGPFQSTPLVLLLVGLLSLAVLAMGRNPAARRVFQGVMVLFVLAGVLGAWLHYDGRVEIRLESSPALAGWAYTLAVHPLDGTVFIAGAGGAMKVVKVAGNE